MGTNNRSGGNAATTKHGVPKGNLIFLTFNRVPLVLTRTARGAGQNLRTILCCTTADKQSGVFALATACRKSSDFGVLGVRAACRVVVCILWKRFDLSRRYCKHMVFAGSTLAAMLSSRIALRRPAYHRKYLNDVVVIIKRVNIQGFRNVTKLLHQWKTQTSASVLP